MRGSCGPQGQCGLPASPFSQPEACSPAEGEKAEPAGWGMGREELQPPAPPALCLLAGQVGASALKQQGPERVRKGA